MWVLTDKGFFSAVQHRDDPDRIIVRARARADLERLLPSAMPISATPDADYPYRAEVSRAFWRTLLTDAVRDLDYDNFKNAVKDRIGNERAGLYMGVWSQLRRIEHEGRVPEEFTEPLWSLEAPAGFEACTCWHSGFVVTAEADCPEHGWDGTRRGPSEHDLIEEDQDDD